MKDGWADRPRISKIAGAMYPSHLDPKTRDEMIRANLEQEAGLKRRISEGDRMYGGAMVGANAFAVAGDVPSLHDAGSFPNGEQGAIGTEDDGAGAGG